MKNKRFTFVDLFSGIGGFHMGCSMSGGKCVMACDISEPANKTYEINFGIKPKGDIYTIPSSEIPDFDLLCAGFPCQAFSQVGQKGAFNDMRGLLIFEVIRILKDKQPKAFILENVRNIQTIQNGRVFHKIISELSNTGYNLETKLLETKDYGTPQIRKRVFFVGVRRDINIQFEFPAPIPLKYSFSDVMGGKTEREYSFTIRIGGRHSGINNRYNWDSYVVDGEVKTITPEQCLLLHGFPKDFNLYGTESQKYAQVGNSVSVYIINEIVKQLQSAGII